MYSMPGENRFFDDFSRLATGAAGAMAGLGREVETLMRQQFERFLAGADLVRRDEFDAVKAMAERARSESEQLAARVAELESRLASAGPAAARTTKTDAAATSAKPAPKPRSRTKKAE